MYGRSVATTIVDGSKLGGQLYVAVDGGVSWRDAIIGNPELVCTAHLHVSSIVGFVLLVSFALLANSLFYRTQVLVCASKTHTFVDPLSLPPFFF